MQTKTQVTLDARAQQRLYVLGHVLAGELTVEEAAEYLKLSVRQVQRLERRYRAEGPAAFVHGNAGRVPINKVDAERREQVIDLARTTYAGFNPVHLAETLAVELPEGRPLSARTIRRILAAGGVTTPHTRRGPLHRSRRARMAREGQLLQTDGSRHNWLEDRGPWLTLVGAIDDATSIVTGASFRAAEDAAGYFTVLVDTAHGYGLPGGLYTDRHGIFVKDQRRPLTLHEQLTGSRSFTQVGRALDEVGIAWIGAHSPQAKGRIERLWGTLQDRLVSELRRQGATTIEDANAVLAAYLPVHNGRFSVPAANAEPAWRSWTLALPPEAIFCFHYGRRVDPDATVSWDGRPLSLPRRRDGASWAGQHVVLQERLDGSLWVSHLGETHQLTAAPLTAPLLRARRSGPVPPQLPLPFEPADPDPSGPAPSAATPTRRPAADHPWRRPNIRRPR
jgi:transposase